MVAGVEIPGPQPLSRGGKAPPDQHAERKVSVCQATSCEMSQFGRSGRKIAEAKVTVTDNRI
jgi:hypothetical protein